MGIFSFIKRIRAKYGNAKRSIIKKIQIKYGNATRSIRSIVFLIMNPALYKGPSYFPGEKKKSNFKVFFEQLSYILRTTEVNAYYFQYGLDQKSKEEMAEYVSYYPFMIKRNELNRKTPNNGVDVLRNKLLFGFVAKEIGISTPPNVALIRNDSLYLLPSMEETSYDYLTTNLDGLFFAKSLDGECGDGIFKLVCRDSKVFINGDEVNPNDLRTIFNDGQYIIQGGVVQHPEMNRMYSGSINTVRLVTVRDVVNKRIVVLPSILRVGANGSYVDNTSQGGIGIGFDLETGTLNEIGLQKPQFGGRRSLHPNTGVVFKEFRIPFIKEAIESAKKFHEVLSGIHSIGWDIAITPDGPCFIEGNDNWEITGPQSCNHGMKREFEQYFK